LMLFNYEVGWGGDWGSGVRGSGLVREA